MHAEWSGDWEGKDAFLPAKKTHLLFSAFFHIPKPTSSSSLSPFIHACPNREEEEVPHTHALSHANMWSWTGIKWKVV